MNEHEMREEYDFEQSTANPYTERLKRAITIRLDTDTIEYFKKLATESGIPYQTLINLFLAQCAREHRKPETIWK